AERVELHPGYRPRRGAAQALQARPQASRAGRAPARGRRRRGLPGHLAQAGASRPAPARDVGGLGLRSVVLEMGGRGRRRHRHPRLLPGSVGHVLARPARARPLRQPRYRGCGARSLGRRGGREPARAEDRAVVQGGRRRDAKTCLPRPLRAAPGGSRPGGRTVGRLRPGVAGPNVRSRRRRAMRPRLSIAPLLVTALLWAAIATSIVTAPRAARAQAPSGTLTVAVATFGNERWLPHLYVGAEDVVLKPMYENLLTRDPKTGDLAPMLAERWKVADSGRTWTFYLRKGVQFHDGRGELTAEDVRFTFATLAKDGSANSLAPEFRLIKSMEVENPYTLTVRFEKPFVAFGNKVNQGLFASVAFIQSKRHMESAKDDGAERHPVATGPWKFVEHIRGDRIVYEAVENHWRATPHFKRLVFIKVPWAQADAVRARKVRVALNLAVDKQAIMQRVLGGLGTALGSWLMYPADPWASDALKKPYPYDPAKAKTLLAEAGYPSGFDVTMNLTPWPGRGFLPDVGEAVATYWEKVGIRVKRRP